VTVGDRARVIADPSGLVPDLWYAGGRRGRRRIPAWAEGFVRLGASAAGAFLDGERLVAAVAVPTRAYAATLVGIGAVAARTPPVLDQEQPSAEALEIHFRLLCSLRPGTTVTVRSGRAKNVGTFEGLESSDHGPLIVIKQKGFRQKFPKAGCHNVSLHGRSLSCLLVGRINVFEEEVTGNDVVTRDSAPLERLLKVGRFASARDHDIRSDILPAAGEVPARLRGAQPDLIVFDGTAGFRHWRENWRNAPWLVVLDRTSAHFDEGVQLINEEFADRASSQGQPPHLEPPPGTELAAFWSAR
jgi:hypothetical protein